MPGYTREYDYETSDDQQTPRKPFTKGFSYENQSPTTPSDLESQQSPSTKRATGLAFNYAPGEEDKLKKDALKEKTKEAVPVAVADPTAFKPSVFKDPKQDSAAFLEGERYLKEAATKPVASAVTAAPIPIPVASGKKKPVKLFVITARKDPKTGKLDMETAVHETVSASQAIETGLIDSKYGLIDPSNGSVIVTDPANGQKEVVQGHIDPITKQIVITSGAVIDPKTSKKDVSLGQIIAIAGQETRAAVNPLAQVPKKRIIKIVVTTAKKDAKSGRIEAEKGHVENLDAIMNPVTGQIETKYGIIDTVNKKIVHKDVKSGKTDVRPIDIDETLGQIVINEGVVDPKSGKIDQHLGQLIIISDKGDAILPITAVTAKRDNQTGQLDPTKAHKESSNGKINPKNGDIVTKYGTIDVKNRKIISRDPKSGKIEERSCQFDGQDNVIILSGVFDPVTGNKDDNLSQILQIGSEVDPEVVVTSSAGKVDKKGLDPKHSTAEKTTGLYDPDTNKVFTKYGVYDPINETLTFIDPKSGKTEVKQGQTDPNSGDVLFKGLVNPKSGKIDSGYGRTIKIEPKHPAVDASVKQQPSSTEIVAKTPVPVSPPKAPTTVSAVPVSAGDKNRIIKLMVITAKKDPKTGHLDIENGSVDHSVGILHSAGEIDSKYGLINPEKGTIVITDPSTGKKETVQGKVDPNTGFIQITTGSVIDPKTGKRDEHLGQIIAVVGDKEKPKESQNKIANALPSHPVPKKRVVKILVITAKRDPKTGKIEAEHGVAEKLTATVDPVTGIIDSKYGKIDPQNKKVVHKDPKTGKTTVSPVQINENTGQIYITENVIDPKTGKVDANIAQIVNVVDPKDPVVVITTITARKDPKTGVVDTNNARTESSNGKINPETGEIVTKHGTINLKLMRITTKDPKTGKITERPVQINKDDIIIPSGIVDPRTGKVDDNFVQIIQVGPEVDPEIQITTYVGKIDSKKNTIDSKNAVPDTTTGLYDPDRNIIFTKYGNLDPVEETLTVVDNKTGKIDKRSGYIEPNTGELVFKGGFVNPKVGKIDPHFGRAVSVHITEPVVDATATQQPLQKDLQVVKTAAPIPEKNTHVPIPAAVVAKESPVKKSAAVVPAVSPKRRVVKIMVITYYKDPKTGQPDVDNGKIEHVTGIVDPKTGFIETKYGLIDPKNGSVITNTPTGQNEVVQGQVNPTTGQIFVSGGKIVDARTGKPEQTAGQVFSVVGLKEAQQPASPTTPKKRFIKITVITTRIDPKTGKPETEKGQIEQSTALLNPATGLIESKYGLIDPKTGKVIVNDLKSGKVDAKNSKINENNGQIILSGGVIDPKTGKIDSSLNQVISIAGQNNPVVEITTMTAKKDPKTGLLDMNKCHMETTRGKKNSATGDIVTKYGTINLKLLRIVTVDPSGKTISRPIQVDSEGNIIVSTGVIDPKTDSIDANLGQVITIGSEIEPEVHVITYVGKVDPKKNTIESKNVVPDVSSALYNPHTHKIDTKYGQIDPVSGTLTYVDPKTGKQDVKQGIIEPATGQILFKNLTNPKTGKADPNYGRIISILISDPQVDNKGQIKEKDSNIFKVDPKTSQIWAFDHQDPVTKQDVYSTGQVDPITGYIITVYGYLDPKSGTISKTTKVDPSNAKIDPETNQIYTKTSETDETGAPLYTVSEIDPKSGQIYTKYGKVDPKTGRLIIVRIYLISQSEPNKIEEIDPKDCQIDEKTGKILNVTTKTVYMYSMVDPKTGKVIQIDPNDPLVHSANTKVTQVLTLSGEIDPVTGKIHTEWGHIDPQTGDIDPKTARRDPVTGELILNYAQIDPTHFTDLKDTKVKVKTFSKRGDGSSSEVETSDDDLNEYAAENLKDLANLHISKTKKGVSAPVIVKTTTKQIVTKDKDGVVQNIEEKVEDGRTGEVTISTKVNKVSQLFRYIPVMLRIQVYICKVCLVAIVFFLVS